MCRQVVTGMLGHVADPKLIAQERAQKSRERHSKKRHGGGSGVTPALGPARVSPVDGPEPSPARVERRSHG